MSSSAPAIEILDWRPVAETLAALQAECAQSDQLVEDLFSELEKVRADVAQKAAEVEQHRQEAQRRRRELEQEREENRRLLHERFASPVLGEGGEPRPATDLELERAALVAELEQVRARAAELHESLLQQQQEHAEQNARLAGEIQSLRQWIERNAELRDATPRDATPYNAAGEHQEFDFAAPGLPSPAPSSGADPVVSSVMAQFAQLQRDVAKRRKRK
jgi:septal ring factor EnvC (AmiA/AmiB activator)